MEKRTTIYDIARELGISTATVNRALNGKPRVKEETRAQVLEALALARAEKLANRQLGQLSGGELQRVLLAMALEPVPNILILDEPLSGVDMDGERQLLALLDEIRTRYDLSILISTHDFNTLHKMDKVILLKQKVLQMGTPEEVLASQEFQTLFYHPTQKGGDAQ